MAEHRDVYEDRGVVAACCGRKLGGLHAMDCVDVKCCPKMWLIAQIKRALKELDVFEGPIKDGMVLAYLQKLVELEEESI